MKIFDYFDFLEEMKPMGLQMQFDVTEIAEAYINTLLGEKYYREKYLKPWYILWNLDKDEDKLQFWYKVAGSLADERNIVAQALERVDEVFYPVPELPIEDTAFYGNETSNIVIAPSPIEVSPDVLTNFGLGVYLTQGS